MDENITPPSGLTKTSLKYPHRVKPNRYGVKLSAVENSFRNGNLYEIDYWMATGVLDEGLEGKTRFRGDYTRSLMTHLAQFLGEVMIISEESLQKYDEILSYLWNKGANKHVDMYNKWMSGLVEYDMADLLIEHGADPWLHDPEQEEETGSWQRRVPQGAVERILSKLKNLQFSHQAYWDSGVNENLNRRIIQRAKKWMEMPSDLATDNTLRNCLWAVANADLETQYSETGPVSAIKALWPGFRDTLISKGAGALLGDHDALSCLMVMGPHKPVHWYEIKAEILRCKTGEEKRDFYAYGREISHQEIQDYGRKMIQSREQAWREKSWEWLHALTGVIRSHPVPMEAHGIWAENMCNERVWTRLLESPGGLELGQKLAEELIQAGHPLPWSPGREQVQVLWNVRTKIDLCAESSGKRRSLRKMRRLRKLLNHPPIKQAGISPAWMDDLLRDIQALERSKDQPGELEAWERIGPKPEKSNAPTGRRKRKNSPETGGEERNTQLSAEELEAFIDLAQTSLSIRDWARGGGGLTSSKWLPHLISSLPRLWSKHATEQQEIEQQLSVLGKREVLRHTMGLGSEILRTLDTPITDVGIVADMTEDRMEKIAGVGYECWATSPYYKALLSELSALDENSEQKDRKLSRTASAFQAWYLSRKSSPGHEGELEVDPSLVRQYISMAGQTMRSEPNLLSMIVHLSINDVVGKPMYEVWESLKKKLARSARVVEMGWKPGERDKDVLTVGLLNKITNISLPDEGQAELIALTSKIGIKKEIFVPRLLESIFEKEMWSQPKMEWQWMADVALDNKWEPRLPTNIDTASSTLSLYFRNAARRRELREIAQNTGGYNRTQPKQDGGKGFRM